MAFFCLSISIMSYFKHGKAGTKIYMMWSQMKQRCFNPKDKGFKSYGARGIRVQSDWVNDFQKFYEYASGLPNYDEINLGHKGISLDRIENDGNYCENNLRWTTASIQLRNQRKRVDNKIGYRGVWYYKRRKRYVAYIHVNKKRVQIGSRKTAKEACELRKAYIKKHNLKGFEIEFND